MPKKIVIKPYGGLANRMRAIDSASILAHMFNIKLNVNWVRSKELNCSFSHLFILPEEINIMEYSLNPVIYRLNYIMIGMLMKIGIYLPFGFDKYLFDSEIVKLNKQQADYPNILSEQRSVYINTANQFYRSRDSFKIFRPIDELLIKIENYTQYFGNYSVGIHIRRTDNINSIKYSPIEGFIELMNAEINDHPDVMFYLATDSENVKKYLKDIYGGQIITHNSTLNRNSEKGIQDAIIDLYCLSKTNKIIGSYFSSFSEVAAQINNIELIQVFNF